MHAHPIANRVQYNEFIPLIDEEFDTLDARQSFDDELSSSLTTTWCNEYLWDDYSNTAD